MDIAIHPATLKGTLSAVPSKSQAHRALICAAFSRENTQILCPQTCRDTEATVRCLNALGADIQRTHAGYAVSPITTLPRTAVLPCGESGATLRFLLPVAGALGVEADFVMEGHLPDRPLSPLWEVMEEKGCTLSRPAKNTVRCTGKLCAGTYRIAGNVSSQFITGLMLAAVLIPGETEICITGARESVPYTEMTASMLKKFGVDCDGFRFARDLRFHSPGNITIEGDWSNAAFFLGANALGNKIVITGLDPDSPQGDRRIAEYLSSLERSRETDVSQVPDLVPILAVVAGAKQGAVFTGIRRLRLKESDRVQTICSMLEALGIRSEAAENALTVYPGSFHGGIVETAGDHRIAMAAAIAAAAASGTVILRDALCTEKSYPAFWEDYKRLGGNYEQFLR